MDSDLEPVALTPQKQDSAWQHVEIFKYGERLQMRCMYCRKMFRGGGITRVKEHLAGKKGQGTICDQVPEDTRLMLQQRIEGTVRRQRKKPRLGDDGGAMALPPCESDGMMIESGLGNGFLTPMVGNETRTKQRTYRSKKNAFENGSASGNNNDMDNLIPVAISSVKNIVHPSFRDRENAVQVAVGRLLFGVGGGFDAVKSVNLQPMIDAIASGGFGVSAPTHDDLRGWILKSCVEETTKEIDECRAMWKRTGCSVLVEELNSDNGFKVLNFLVYCPEKVVFLKSVDASEVFSSADGLFELLSEVVKEIGDSNVVQVVTKCEDHYAIAGKKLMHVYPSLYWVPCAADCIDKILEEFGSLDWISKIIEQTQAITRFIYNRSDVLNLMRKFTSGNEILRPLFSTSATNFATLCKISDFKFNLQGMVTSPEWNECSHLAEPSALAMNAITDESFWKDVALVNFITGPLLRVLRIVCSEKRPGMGYVYAAMYRAKEAIKIHLVNREEYVIYWKIIDRWWEQQQQNVPLHAAGFFLNPKFFYKADEELRSEIIPAVLDCIERLVPDDKIQDKISKELNSYKIAAGVFGRNLAIRARDSTLPAEWWSTYGESCLNLSRFAIRILSQTCSSSVGCRRNQIPVEQIYQSKNSIEQKRLNDLLFVQYNMSLRQLDHESGNETLDALSHSKMDVLKDWVSGDEACVEGSGSSDWKSLESIKRTQIVPIIDDTEDLGSGFNDIEIFKGEKEVMDDVYYTNTSEKVFT